MTIKDKLTQLLKALENIESEINLATFNETEKKVFYNHKADKRERKWNVETNLKKEIDKNLPDYVLNNREKFSDWLD